MKIHEKNNILKYKKEIIAKKSHNFKIDITVLLKNAYEQFGISGAQSCCVLFLQV